MEYRINRDKTHEAVDTAMLLSKNGTLPTGKSK